MSGAAVAASAIQSVDPPKPSTSVTVTGSPGATTGALTVSVGGGSIVNVSADEVPPPGAGVVTRTCAVPVAATSVPGMDASSFELLMNLVGRAAPFHSTTDRPMKPWPLTVSVIAPSPARVLTGDSVVTTGAGLSSGTRVARASNTLTRGTVAPGPKNQNLVSVIGSPVVPQRVKDRRSRSRPEPPA